MKFLLTNDDGIYAPGIQNLAQLLIENGHKITLVAPDRERSATGHSISLYHPLRVKEVTFDKLPDTVCYKIDGSPADCVKIGINELISFKPDYILSGINEGSNIGDDVVYSGTVSAAFEGWMMGYNSIAVSLAVKENNNYRETARILNKIINKLDKKNKKNELYNINFPDLSLNKIKGIRVTKLSKNLYNDFYESRTDPMGNKYYWLKGSIKEDYQKNTDIWALKNNLISITPLQLNLTDMSKLNELKKVITDNIINFNNK